MKKKKQVKNSCGGSGCSISLYILPWGATSGTRRKFQKRRVKKLAA